MNSKLPFFYFTYTFNSASALSGTHNESSCSSGPESPHRHPNQQSQQQQIESTGRGGVGGRAQYLSATCVIVTHYDGDSSSIVDEHFAKALNFSDKSNKGELQHNNKNTIWRSQVFFAFAAIDFLVSLLIWQLIVTREHHWFDNAHILR